MVVTIHLVEVDALRIDVSDLRSEGTQKQKKQPEIKLTIFRQIKNCSRWQQPQNAWLSKWQTIQKTPTAIHFSASGEALLVSTRSGSVMEYRITDSDFSSGGIELVSHFSMVLDHCLSPGKPKFLLSADRDEKVRVSHYPNTQIIECFCLGHSSFVNSVCCLDDQIAISGGGDGILRVWKFKIGKCLCESSKLGDSPIRKVRALHENGIVALSEGALEIFHFVFNPQGPSVELSRTFFADDQLFDFAVDEQCQRIFAVGRVYSTVPLALKLLLFFELKILILIDN
uniref:WD_REPEATS_REGION domain-containing protein n=1 Tax=Globodera pallida TaxID=36090 RepID=A0A183BYZ5_GLOPA